MTVFRAAVLARDTITSPACELSPRARALLLLLATYADGSGSCHPSVATLARALVCHPGSLRKARAELVAAGVIRVDLSVGRETNRYRFPFTVAGPPPPLALVPGDAQPAPGGAGCDPVDVVPNPRPTARVDYPQPAPHGAQPAPHGAPTRAPGRDQVEALEVVKTEVGAADVDAVDGDPADVAIPLDVRAIWERARDAAQRRAGAS